ncbi:hypothetical protein ITJ44_14725 [Clavibacter sp. VKM Ac-2873]|uniref:hypothetical protein n=1 Tax=Clavibacter sp. VKM Ac-2873 TaxID=2783813 RepID=UPI00188C98FC|nr:hypothetical protein [Clavibacter sp. VKM Ac-2873]MBF4619328.1 hypothetical protein [Clavibacter sp. VKM Ac-2873]
MSDDPDDTARAAPASGMAPDADRDVAEELVSRLQLIEEQPLGDRAAAFALLHDELRTRLEGGDGAAARG